MANSTHEALRAHLSKWAKGPGFNANPIAILQESVNFLCGLFDELADRERLAFEMAAKREREQDLRDHGGGR